MNAFWVFDAKTNLGRSGKFGARGRWKLVLSGQYQRPEEIYQKQKASGKSTQPAL
jgi:hypothetical protein